MVSCTQFPGNLIQTQMDLILPEDQSGSSARTRWGPLLSLHGVSKSYSLECFLRWGLLWEVSPEGSAALSRAHLAGCALRCKAFASRQPHQNLWQFSWRLDRVFFCGMDPGPDSSVCLILCGREFWVWPDRSVEIISRMVQCARATTAAQRCNLNKFRVKKTLLWLRQGRG